MTRIMFGPVILLAALASPTTPATGQVAEGIAKFQPNSRATASATVSIRIISGVQFGSGRLSGAEGAIRRKAELAEADGQVRPAELLEFQ
jgi:hypothetical protein